MHELPGHSAIGRRKAAAVPELLRNGVHVYSERTAALIPALIAELFAGPIVELSVALGVVLSGELSA